MITNDLTDAATAAASALQDFDRAGILEVLPTVPALAKTLRDLLAAVERLEHPPVTVDPEAIAADVHHGIIPKHVARARFGFPSEPYPLTAALCEALRANEQPTAANMVQFDSADGDSASMWLDGWWPAADVEEMLAALPSTVDVTPSTTTAIALRNLAADNKLLWEVARRAIEDALVDSCASRISFPFRANGLVIREPDAEPSSIIRMGPETAVRIALEALADHLEHPAIDVDGSEN